MDNPLFKLSTDRGSVKRRAASMARAQKMLDRMPPFALSSFAARCRGPQDLPTAHARYDRHVTEIGLQATDPSPRYLAIGRNEQVTYSW